MKRTILDHETFSAVIEDGRLAEYIPKDPNDQSGDILLGKTDRIMPGLQCAFVDIGRRKSGFLPLKENSGSFTGPALRSGDPVIVQIKKEERADKGAFLSRDVTIAGRNIILMPMNRYIGVSSRIADEETRSRLKKLGSEIAGGRFGLVLRHGSDECGLGEIAREAEECREKWEAVLRKAESGGKPGTILHHGGIAEQLAEDYLLGSDAIVPAGGLEAAYRKQLAQAMERTVPLPHGGNIVIDCCEAMTVIDVNTASSVTDGGKEQTVLETNLEACGAICDQVRLRNLSGIIVIDFIDLEREEDRASVRNRLEQCFREDRIKTVIHGWTSLGLMEMTRKRTRPSLYEDCFEACPACRGRGYRPKEKNG